MVWTRRQLLISMAGLSVGVGLGACAPLAPSAPTGTPAASTTIGTTTQPPPTLATPRAGGTITVGISADIQKLDPHISYVVVDRYVTENVYEGLVGLDDKMDPVPALAERWTQVDPTTYQFTLRQGVKFHNGRTVVADDVVWSFNRIRDSKLASRWASEFKFVNSISATDASTVVFKLTNPYGPFVASVAALKIAPKEAEADLDKKAVGTGPFEFVDWTPNEQVRIKKHPGYWNSSNSVLLDSVTMKPITEPETRLVNLQTGAAQMIDAVPFKDVDTIKNAANLQVFSVNSSTTYDYMAFNFQRPLLQSKQVRQAIAMAMDKNAIVQTIMSGHATPAMVPLPQQHWAYAQLPGYSFDLDKARQTLASAGLAGPIETSITVSPSYPEQVKMAELLQANLAQVGIKLNVESMEWTAWLDKVVQKRDFDMFISYSSPVSWDPDGFFYYLYHTGEPLNLGAYSNSQVDGLLQQAQQGTTQEARRATYQQIMQILVDEVPRVIIDHRELDVGAQRAVQGFHLNQRGDLAFAGVSVSA